MYRNKVKLSILFLLTMVLFSFDVPEPRILIIGDSISIGYTPYVEAYFSGKAVVSHNPGNAQHTGTGLKNIEDWIGDGDWDIIQFNWGLWDLCYKVPSAEGQAYKDKIHGTMLCSLDDYVSNLDSIVTILQEKSDAKLIFLTTTYVPEDEPGRFSNDVGKYNEAAKSIMQNHSVTVHDIYKESVAIHNVFGKGSSDVHYTPEGYKKLGSIVAEYLEETLDSNP
jgi:hypothetical protein